MRQRQRYQPNYQPQFTAVETKVILQGPKEPKEEAPKAVLTKVKTTTTKSKTVSFPSMGLSRAGLRADYSKPAYDTNKIKKTVVKKDQKLTEFTTTKNMEKEPKKLSSTELYDAYDTVPFESRKEQLKKEMAVSYGKVKVLLNQRKEADYSIEAINKALTFNTSGQRLPASIIEQETKGYLTIGGINPNKIFVNKRNVLSESGLFGDRLREEI